MQHNIFASHNFFVDMRMIAHTYKPFEMCDTHLYIFSRQNWQYV